MLALSREVGQSITCKLPGGDLIQVKVLNWDGRKVRLGFSAPLEVQIHRDEIWAKIEAKGQGAT